MKRLIYVLVILLFLIAACARKSGKEQFVARVGKTALTLKDIRKSIPPEYSSIVTKKQYEEYVYRWMEDEILYQKALRMGLQRIPDIDRQIRKARRKILVAQAISRLCPPVNNISEYRIQQYYEKNRLDFTRKQWEIKSIYILIPDKDKAYNVLGKIKSDNFLKIARRYSIDPVDVSSSTVPYVSANDMLPELASVVFGIRINGTTPPIKTSRGYYIIRVIDKKPPNSIRALSEVKEEIINRLVTKEQKGRIEKLVKKLKKSIPVEYFPDRLPALADSASKPELPATDSTNTYSE